MPLHSEFLHAQWETDLSTSFPHCLYLPKFRMLFSMLTTVKTFYSLTKSRRILRQHFKLYRRKASILDSDRKENLQSLLTSLQTAITQKNPETAKRLASSLEEASKKFMTRTPWDKTRDFIVAIVFALTLAISIRQVWFELYTIPSGSMRPTLKEEDLLLVSKTDYGINTLSPTSHVQFDPSLVKRGSIVIFSGQDMDIYDVDTTYFFVIPGKKQFVKRLIAKPGDTLYFYGGHIYGIDANGEDLTELRDTPWFQDLEHIPFIRFDGKVEMPNQPRLNNFSPVIFSQMNEPVAKLTSTPFGSVEGEMLLPVKDYFDLWGFKNYAMARLLTREQATIQHPSLMRGQPIQPLYLELTHHPSINGAKVERDEYGRPRPMLATSVSLLPVDNEKIDAMMQHMTTCRFMVKDGIATRYGSSFEPKRFLPKMPGVPDGTYEIQDGKASRIHFLGITQALPDDHPLLKRDAKHLQLLYNIGIEMDERFAPSQQMNLAPSRYAYFAQGDLYLMGSPIFFKQDPLLVEFQQRELQKQALSSYVPFEDAGAPLTKDGKVDVALIRQYGLKVPEKTYLALGDNHAMSGDSRQFGFVPQDNMRGGASFLFWPPGPRWGRLPQPSTPHATFPNIVVWTFFLSAAVGTSLFVRRKYNKPFKFD